MPGEKNQETGDRRSENFAGRLNLNLSNEPEPRARIPRIQKFNLVILEISTESLTFIIMPFLGLNFAPYVSTYFFFVK